MVKNIADFTTLNNGVNMPWFGLGVYKAEDGREVEQAVLTALETGYRSIDTAAMYQNEVGVGRAVRDSGLKRKDVFVTTKVWNSDQGYESTLKAFEESQKRLGLDYIDLYLIHWPVKGKYTETWRALEKLYEEGVVRAIGVSNFNPHHLEDILATGQVKPAVNQVEFHPKLNQKGLRDYCREQDIQLEAWSPLMRGRILEDEIIMSIAKKYGKTPAQLILRWDLQHGVVTIPKSVKPQRIKENADVFDFELSQEDMEKIDALNENIRTGADPDDFNF